MTATMWGATVGLYEVDGERCRDCRGEGIVDDDGDLTICQECGGNGLTPYVD